MLIKDLRGDPSACSPGMVLKPDNRNVIAPLSGATLLSDCQSLNSGGTWGLTPFAAGVGTADRSATLQVIPDTTYGTRNGIRMKANTGYDPGCAYELTTPQAFDRLTLQVLVWMMPFQVSGGNDYQTANLRIRMHANAPGSPSSCYLHTAMLNPGWNLVTISGISGGEVTNSTSTGYSTPMWSIESGTPTVNSLIRTVEFYYGGSGAYAPEIYVAQVSTGHSGRAAVTCVFDDAYSSVYQYAIPLANQYGVKLTIGVITSVVGTGGYMTLSQLQEAYDQGHDLINHTNTHGAGGANPAGSSTAFLRDTAYTGFVQGEYETARDQLQSWGFTRNNSLLCAASPFGNCVREQAYAAHVAMQSSLGLHYLRGTEQRVGGVGLYGAVGSPCTALDGTSANLTAGQINARIIAAVGAGGHVDLLGHKIVTGTPADALEYKNTEIERIFRCIGDLVDEESIQSLTVPKYIKEIYGKTPILT